MFMIHKQVIIFFYYKITYTIFYVYWKNVEMCYNIRYAIASSLERSITMNTYQTFEEYIYDKYYQLQYIRRVKPRIQWGVARTCCLGYNRSIGTVYITKCHENEPELMTAVHTSVIAFGFCRLFRRRLCVRVTKLIEFVASEVWHPKCRKTSKNRRMKWPQ